ncbi:aminotransferase class I/II-fold pyridoxal phosphate-dependent enzyme [bacterium]|nr:aminotransferase class I/II-fold pyridoxal phosphate-dependent enzyme [bacterium]
MSTEKLCKILKAHVDGLKSKGVSKGNEMVIMKTIRAAGSKGPRYHIQGYGEKEFLKMNSNSYLGMSLLPEVIEAEEKASRDFGVGPGAVRFISGTYINHIELEKKLAEFHKRESGMIFSAAYVTSMSVIAPLTTKETIVISDALNHNCIINAMRMSRPAGKGIYKHNDMEDLENHVKDSIGKAKRLLVITDGIFSMRGDHAPLGKLVEVCKRYEDKFEEGIITIIDDSHGVGAFGRTGRGTEEYTGAKVDLIIGTLGKAFGVNGGYVVGEDAILKYFRETSPMYIYSNPITPSEAAAALKVLELTDSPEGIKRLEYLRKLTAKFRQGLTDAGFETLEGEHPVVPLMVRDTQKTSDIVSFLVDNGIIATGLNFPVVPKGDEEIRFQIAADHTEEDINYALEILGKFE